jgi:hypothetical protein
MDQPENAGVLGQRRALASQRCKHRRIIDERVETGYPSLLQRPYMHDRDIEFQLCGFGFSICSADCDHVFACINKTFDLQPVVEVLREFSKELPDTFVALIMATPREFGGLNDFNILSHQHEQRRDIALCERLINFLNLFHVSLHSPAQ